MKITKTTTTSASAVNEALAALDAHVSMNVDINQSREQAGLPPIGNNNFHRRRAHKQMRKYLLSVWFANHADIIRIYRNLIGERVLPYTFQFVKMYPSLFQLAVEGYLEGGIKRREATAVYRYSYKSTAVWSLVPLEDGPKEEVLMEEYNRNILRLRKYPKWVLDNVGMDRCMMSIEDAPTLKREYNEIKGRVHQTWTLAVLELVRLNAREAQTIGYVRYYGILQAKMLRSLSRENILKWSKMARPYMPLNVLAYSSPTTLIQFVVDGIGFDCTVHDFSLLRGSFTHLLRRSVQWHAEDRARRAQRTDLHTQTEVPDIPMATGIEELEEYRVKSSREMVSLGHRYGHCLGTLWCSKDVFYHKDEAVAQVRDGKIVQIHGPGNRYTSACKTLEALIKRTHRNK